MQGGRPDANKKEYPALETVWGKHLRGDNAEKSVDVLYEGGEVRIRRGRDAVSAILDQFRRKWTPTCNGLK